MKIRIYCPFFPFPITEGAFQVIADQVFTLAHQGHAVELVVVKEEIHSVQKKIEAFQQQGGILNFQWKAFSHPRLFFGTGLGVWDRMLRVLGSFFTSLSSTELFFYSPPSHSMRASLLNEVDLSIYHYSFAFAWLTHFPEEKTQKKVVFFHNLESDLFFLRAQETKNRLMRHLLRRNAQRLKAHETQLLEYCDEVWLISPLDALEYERRHPQEKLRIRVVPPTFGPKFYQRRKSLFLKKQLESFQDQRQGQRPLGPEFILGYLGGMDFAPNRISAFWLVKELAPALAARGFQGKLKIAGKSPPRELMEAANAFPWIEILGFLEDTEDFWSSLSWMLVPHLAGSGVRMKLLEALVSGVPTLTHPEAAQCLETQVQQTPALIVKNSPQEWADILCQETPFQKRRQLERLFDQAAASPKDSFFQGIFGSEVYGFLKNP